MDSANMGSIGLVLGPAPLPKIASFQLYIISFKFAFVLFMYFDWERIYRNVEYVEQNKLVMEHIRRTLYVGFKFWVWTQASGWFLVFLPVWLQSYYCHLQRVKCAATHNLFYLDFTQSQGILLLTYFCWCFLSVFVLIEPCEDKPDQPGWKWRAHGCVFRGWQGMNRMCSCRKHSVHAKGFSGVRRCLEKLSVYCIPPAFGESVLFFGGIELTSNCS